MILKERFVSTDGIDLSTYTNIKNTNLYYKKDGEVYVGLVDNGQTSKCVEFSIDGTGNRMSVIEIITKLHKNIQYNNCCVFPVDKYGNVIDITKHKDFKDTIDDDVVVFVYTYKNKQLLVIMSTPYCDGHREITYCLFDINNNKHFYMPPKEYISEYLGVMKLDETILSEIHT